MAASHHHATLIDDELAHHMPGRNSAQWQIQATLQALQMPDSPVVPGRGAADRGLTGMNRDRPGLRLALATCHSGDTFVVVTKLDRLARSLPHARDILDELTRRNVRLS
jgi:hypothetical protein